jgi:SAM-dependent methyltransferase
VDVIISNCVINLSADKDRLLREAFRVLKPGGRFAVSDVVVRGAVPDTVRRNVELWIGCVAGALEESSYHDKLVAAGFESVEIEPWRVYNLGELGIETDVMSGDAFASAFIRASKPAAKSCCGPTCCAA